jgi:hypothetical protein
MIVIWAIVRTSARVWTFAKMLDIDRRLTTRKFARRVSDLANTIIIIAVVHSELNSRCYTLCDAHTVHDIHGIIDYAENKKY